jgi:hypothetical protein
VRLFRHFSDHGKEKQMKSKAFLFIYTTANLGLIIYGVMAGIVPNVLLNAFSQYVYKFPTDATTAIAYQLALFRLLGYFNLLLGALGLLLLWRWMVQRELWLMMSLIALTTLSYLGPVVLDNTVGHIGIFEVIELVLFVAAVFSGFLMLVDKKTR